MFCQRESLNYVFNQWAVSQCIRMLNNSLKLLSNIAPGLVPHTELLMWVHCRNGGRELVLLYIFSQ
jgi:hypothetical protein